MNIYRDIGKVLLKLDDNYYEKGIKKISVIDCCMLIAGIISNAFSSRLYLYYSSQFFSNFKIRIWIQMTISAECCLYFFMS